MPLIRAAISLPDSSIQILGGLEKTDLIRFNVKTQPKKDAEVIRDDVDVSITLSEDGRVLKVVFDWRPEMATESEKTMTQLQTFLTKSAFNFDESAANAAVLEKIVRLTLNESAENLKDLMSLDVTNYLAKFEGLKSNVESLYISNAEIVQVSVDYVGQWVIFGVRES